MKDFYAGILFHNTPTYYELHNKIKNEVDLYELILGQYATEPDVLEDIKSLGKPLILHTNLLSPGSYNGINQDVLEKINSKIEISQALWIGDHLCYSKIPGIESGTLLPPFLLEEELNIYRDNINKIINKLNAPLLLENVIMHYNPLGELSLGEFITKLTESTAMGIVLSLENISQCKFYSHLDPYEFIDSLPLDKVVQLHCSLGNFEEQKLEPELLEKQIRHFEIIEYLSTKQEFRPKALIWELETETASLPETAYIKEKLAWARDLFLNRGIVDIKEEVL